MLPLIRSELLKLKGSWLFRLSLFVAVFFPLLALAVTLTGAQAASATESRFLLLLRQSHIFLTLLMGNLMAALIATDLFHKEFQNGTIADIIAVPVKRSRFILAKEIVLFAWMEGLCVASYLICVAAGILSLAEGFSPSLAWAGLWRFVAATAIQFIPLQLFVLLALAFRNYFVPLGASIVLLVGTIVAFNTKAFIFMYPYSIGFVLTNFVEPIKTENIAASAASLAALTAVCVPGILLRFRRADL
jgi:bacitracin transport system permease protein